MDFECLLDALKAALVKACAINIGDMGRGQLHVAVRQSSGDLKDRRARVCELVCGRFPDSVLGSGGLLHLLLFLCLRILLFDKHEEACRDDPLADAVIQRA
ncbi:hypothetical protein [Palleronia sp.]|uniref:hypothetical protein n=1 Tax=Palleronia sp. TaxID=1940284 RepID=UPI0035C7C0DA